MMKALHNVTFPRSFGPDNVAPAIKPLLVTFSDGNEDSFGTNAYTIWTLLDKTREARLIMSKAKLGPLLYMGEVQADLNVGL